MPPTDFIRCVSVHFPGFARHLDPAQPYLLEEILPPASPANLAKLETRLGIPLPETYKRLLSCARGFWLKGGRYQFGAEHPFFQNFKPFETLSPAQQQRIRDRNQSWPPPSQGMLCFAEAHILADGDQLLFDVSRGLIDGDYPVFYYDHESSPPSVHPVASSFAEFIESFLDNPVQLNHNT